MKLMIELLFILFFLILIIIFLSYKITSNKYSILNIKFNKAESKLKKALEEKFNLTIKVVEFLNKNATIDEDKLYNLLNANLKKTDLIELNEILVDADKYINDYLSHNEKLINYEEYVNLDMVLKELNVIINASRKYYNENVKEYNQLVKKFPTSIIAKIKKLEEKTKLKESHNNNLKILKK